MSEVIRLDHLPYEHNERNQPVASSTVHNLNRKVHEMTTEPPLIRENALVSDHPDDYLHAYANTKTAYSDRVHATVVALSFGNPAQLFWKSPRATLFDQIDAMNILERPVAPFEKLRNGRKSRFRSSGNICEGLFELIVASTEPGQNSGHIYKFNGGRNSRYIRKYQ